MKTARVKLFDTSFYINKVSISKAALLGKSKDK